MTYIIDNQMHKRKINELLIINISNKKSTDKILHCNFYLCFLYKQFLAFS